MEQSHGDGCSMILVTGLQSPRIDRIHRFRPLRGDFFPLSHSRLRLSSPSVAHFGPLESCERVIIEDVASIGAISHLCRLSNRYAITSQRQLSWLKCLLVKGVAPRSLSLLPGVDADRVLIHLPCRVAPSQTGWPGTPLLSPDEIISMALYTCVVSVFRPAPFFSRSVPSIRGGSNSDRRETARPAAFLLPALSRSRIDRVPKNPEDLFATCPAY